MAKLNTTTISLYVVNGAKIAAESIDEAIAMYREYYTDYLGNELTVTSAQRQDSVLIKIQK